MAARILVVEDNPLNLKLMRDVLEFQGFEVLTAKSVEEGIAVASITSPDLVLMDLQLPGMDGHEALLRMRSDPRCRMIPVVAVTAFAMKGDEEVIRQGGCEAYISKPISIVAFLDTVRRFLGEA